MPRLFCFHAKVADLVGLVCGDLAYIIHTVLLFAITVILVFDSPYLASPVPWVVLNDCLLTMGCANLPRARDINTTIEIAEWNGEHVHIKWMYPICVTLRKK